MASELVATKEEAQEVNGELEDEHVELEERRVFKHTSLAGEAIIAKLKKLHIALDQTQEQASKNDGSVAKPKTGPKPSFGSALDLPHSIQELEDLKTAIIDEKKRQETQEATLKEHPLVDRKKYERALQDAATTSKPHALTQINTISDFVSLSAPLSSSKPSRPSTTPIDDAERRSIAKANKILLEHPELRAAVVDRLLNIENPGDVDGLPYARLRALTKHVSTPLSQPDYLGISMTASGLVYVNGHSSVLRLRGAPDEVPHSPSTFGGGWRPMGGTSPPATVEGPGWSEGSGERGRERGRFRGRGDRGDDWRGGKACRGGRGNCNSSPQPHQQ